MPLRLPRLAQAVAVIGLASAPLAGFCLPAHADTWRQSEWWLGKLHVLQAWRSGGGTDVTVAVLADGVAASQADLTGRVTIGPDFTRSARIPGGPYYGRIGTGLASLIAGHGHGSKAENGIYGIAGDARILSLRVTLSPGDPLWSNTALTSRLPADITAGIRYAVDHKASVIALPADPGMPGIPGWGGIRGAAGGSQAERAAIGYAIRHNVVLVAPAGDNGQAGDAPNYPAAYQGVIAVGAFDKNFVKAPYSSRRGYVTLTAAGRGVVAAAPAGYQTMNSTWAASAIVAGVATLVRSQFPNLTAAQVLKAMAEGTAYQPPGGLLSGSGYGTVDAAKAVSLAATMSPPHARPASLGALPRRRPVTPPVPSNGSIITRNLLTDGIISAGVLAGLLIPITWYGSILKRREHEVALASATRSRAGRPPPGQGGMAADPLLEYFGPQEAPPAIAAGGQRALAGSRHPGLTGRSTLSSAFAPRPMLPAPPAPAGHRQDARSQPDAWTSADAGSRPAGQMQRTLRHVPVAGTPPWEPAPQPTSELPWAVVQSPALGPPRRGIGQGTSQPPPESVFDVPQEARSSAPRSLFDPDQDEDQPDQDSFPDPDSYRGQGRQTDTGGRPIYVWNPDAPSDGGAIRLVRTYQD